MRSLDVPAPENEENLVNQVGHMNNSERQRDDSEDRMVDSPSMRTHSQALSPQAAQNTVDLSMNNDEADQLIVGEEY